MNRNLSNQTHSDIIQDSRWETFKRNSQRRTIIIGGCTILLLGISVILGQLWLFPVAMGILWLVVMYWKVWSKRN
ncbi:hypothetical protein [Merismopedia glauca]|uniref:Uncharacterized protein n=1 Tax=Merismopedia glauca CCAP 1448/3 TaxID=1296344 RepID=A0A2T1C4Q4_9CYAN|nr:hypothetical protein [Merismopedia glauca]PSB03260.1 hypothetical protein C7B64_09180 [Merismopedia glauca CCAP 1448/3]